MAVRAARDLQEAGYEVEFLVHESTRALLQGGPFRFQTVRNHIGGLLRLLIDARVSSFKPGGIVYFDFFNTVNLLHRLGIGDSRFLLGYDCLTASLDTWDSAQTGHLIDLPDGSTRSLVLEQAEETLGLYAQIEHRLIPVPVAACDGRRGKFRCLPDWRTCRWDLEARQRLGLSPGERLVLFPTSPWQQPDRLPADSRGLAGLLPRILHRSLSKLGSRIHLVHVGPSALELPQEGCRYHWLPSCRAEEFDSLLAAADLVVSGNIAATTNVKAMAFKTPLLVLRNSRRLRRPGDLEEVERLDNGLKGLLKSALPIHPFTVWPLGYQRFLEPILSENAYCECFDWIEMLDSQKLEERVEQLLYSPLARQSMWRRQEAYLDSVSRLPSAGEWMNSYLN